MARGGLSMVQSFSLNQDNDIYLNSFGNISISTGIDAILQACKNAAQAQLGEMILSTNTGIPNFQAIWVGVPNYTIFTKYLRKSLESVNGVVSVDNLVLLKKDDVLSYTATINTIHGTGKLNG